MKLSFSSNAFVEHSLDDALRTIARIGYQGAEIMADRPHFWPPDLDKDRVDAVGAKAAELGLTLCNINGFPMQAIGTMHRPSWIEKNDVDRQKRVDHTIACVELAHMLGIPYVSTEPGGPVEGGAEARGQEYALFARTLDQVIPRAEELGVTLLIAPEPDLLFEDMDSMVAFLENMESPALGVNFDLGHFFCIGDDPAGLIRTYGAMLKHIHIEDIAPNRAHRHLIPGMGAMDFGAIFDALKKVDYDGFVTVELYPYSKKPEMAAEEAFRFLKPFFEGTV